MSSSPSKPLQIGSPKPAPTAAGPSSGSFGALRAQQYAGTPPVPNIPARFGTPRTSSPMFFPSGGASPGGAPGTSPFPRPPSAGGLSATRPALGARGSGGDTPPDEASEADKAKVIRRHLVSKEERERQQAQQQQGGRLTPSSASGSRRGSDVGVSRRPSRAQLQRQETEVFPVPYDAPGADVTHDLYKWQADQRRRPRAASFAGSTVSRNPAFAHIHEPGGFRRNYVLLRAEQEGAEEPQMLRSFIEFLYIFGHFAGEDLEEIEEEDEYTPFEDDDLERGTFPGPSSSYSPADGLLADHDDHAKPDETTPLMESQISQRSHRARRKRSKSVAQVGDATVTQAVLMLLKSFVGTGILFLGKAFMNGGILFSAALLSFIAMISLYSFLLLVKAKFAVHGSFGDMGGKLYGPWMRYAILTSIVVSQLGFVSAYIIFVSENLQSFWESVTDCMHILPVKYFIFVQLIVFLPLALIRNLAKLSTTALVADVFIVAGLIYIFGSEARIMARNGPAEVQLFNPRDWTLMVGTAIFSFEGIGLVIPVTDAMREPHKFPKVLTGVMISLMFLFGGGGVMSYLTFGPEVQTVVTLNLPNSRTLQVVQFLYSAAILLSVPLQLFPAVRIMETGLFARSGKGDTKVKWLKNFFRFCIVMVCAVISYLGAADLDKFVSFIGCFACVPLCYIYPPMLHLRACARTRRARIADYVLIVFGVVAAVYTTGQTLRMMMEPSGPAIPSVGRCDSPPTLG